MSEKQITIQEAIEIADSLGITATIPTMIKWVKDNNLGHQPGGSGGRWYIYEDIFIKFLKGGF